MNVVAWTSAALLLCVEPARALTIQVAPEAPVAGEVVTVTISDIYPHSCWLTASHDCGELVGQVIDVRVESYDWSRPWLLCLTVIVPFDVTCAYTFDDAGTYTVLVRDTGESLYDPYQHEASRDIVIADGVSVEKLSWAACKAQYR